jgi:sterol desaturase/sphingolipid hydroxylase (fatty acid hydroxylase superfamily)
MLGSGLIFSFLFYEFCHYTAHQRKPTTRVMKYLKKHHMRHHFGDEQKLFGVTSPLWDYVFGTSAPLAKAKAPDSRAARSASAPSSSVAS